MYHSQSFLLLWLGQVLRMISLNPFMSPYHQFHKGSSTSTHVNWIRSFIALTLDKWNNLGISLTSIRKLIVALIFFCFLLDCPWRLSYITVNSHSHTYSKIYVSIISCITNHLDKIVRMWEILIRDYYELVFLVCIVRSY